MRTTFPQESGELSETRTDSAQNPPESESENVRFPKVIRNKKTKAEVTIYGKSKGGERKKDGSVTQPYPFYRVCWRVSGKRMMKSLRTYSEAKKTADGIVADLGSGSQKSALTVRQAIDALAAIERLDAFYRATGRRVSLLASVSDYCEAATKGAGRTVAEMVDGFLSSVAAVKRIDIKKAVDDFITADEPRTKANNGERAQLSEKYAYNRAIMLRRFADCFPNTAVSGLTKGHLDTFIGGLARMKSKSRNGKPVASAKGRNHHRAAIRQFLAWAVRKDYLAPTHRLGEADGMRPEHANNGQTEIYTPKEFRALLQTAKDSMRAIVAIGGFAGLRTSELLRLDWADVWRVPGHIEITSGKSKTRQRRLVEICPALESWLAPFRTNTSGRLCTLHEITWQQHFVALCDKARVNRKPNGLRHSFCTYHFAAHANENQTAQQAGNSPAMIHAHYKGLATKAEGEKWFAIRPAKAGKNVIHLPAASSSG
jgi:integrase